jgi:hypothetical protein
MGVSKPFLVRLRRMTAETAAPPEAVTQAFGLGVPPVEPSSRRNSVARRVIRPPTAGPEAFAAPFATTGL